ncbi:protein YIPF2 [Gadus chalcogrammus]|uniref:protein YIPF2 n=1 Tax=Gadus chalcogrammus TaxID=1042646 RepID=UPI0024C261DD|nr:protein YIPF2 [Gadus chalcogrammus]
MDNTDELKFQDFEEVSNLLSFDPNAPTVAVSDSLASLASLSGEEDVKLDLNEDEEGLENSKLLGETPTGGFWTFDYYQSFFNVETVQVMDRLKGSVMPIPGRNFVKYYLRNKPDLYGPFWICVTLVFSVAISGNLSTFLSQFGDQTYHYRPQFHRVTIAAIVIFMYASLVPLCAWGFLTWRRGPEGPVGCYTFLETVCVYGYSLFIFIPTSLLWIIPLEWLRWLLILVSTVVSGSVLVFTFLPVVRDHTKVTAATTLLTILVLHSLLAIGCKMYFFHTAVHMATPGTTTLPMMTTQVTQAH